jgi:CheY-like chemotaxis protein
VDDDTAVREVISSILRELGYVVMEVGSGGAALDLLSREASVDLVMLDFAMPGMNGVDLARQVHSQFPTLPLVFMTGYVDNAALEEIGDARIIKKPFVGDELAIKVQAALNEGRHRSRGKVVPLRAGPPVLCRTAITGSQLGFEDLLQRLMAAAGTKCERRLVPVTTGLE